MSRLVAALWIVGEVQLPFMGFKYKSTRILRNIVTSQFMYYAYWSSQTAISAKRFEVILLCEVEFQ